MSENNEFREIDLSQLQKVEVRDQGLEEKWNQVWLLSIRPKEEYGYCVINEYYLVSYWKYCRPYKEPTKRPMTDREIFNALKKEDCWLGIVYDGEVKGTSNIWGNGHNRENHRITYDGGETWHKLEVEE